MNGSFALLAVATAAAGYILATECFKFRYKTSRQSGHRLYLSTLTLGIYALFSALVFTWATIPDDPPISKNITAAFLTVFFAKIFSELYNRKPRPSQIASALSKIRLAGIKNTITRIKNEFNVDEVTKFNALWQAWQDDDIELICAYAAEEMKPISVTLDTNKVYVGMVADTLEPSDTNSYLSILPIYSGYRNKDNMSYILNHKYETLINGLLNNDEDIVNAKLDYIVAIPLERIVTIHVFNEELYQEVSGSSAEEIGQPG
ncbi:hypothetical protein [uncultured Marinobacter sp.]|uniref:hypothetical protein n=1 Tax=uncultured Marinobacter sp. TaxID=187379 RepID=UPI000C08F9FB|nr:hypothetical protein [Marinobacter sp.]MBI42260.1 hypothetical protein [Oceanospirillales bacterium]|tara:strand:+ start:3246 stop:4028 length:783 start_codon:yes stop_codon:yes gene_type:complete